MQRSTTPSVSSIVTRAIVAELTECVCTAKGYPRGAAHDEMCPHWVVPLDIAHSLKLIESEIKKRAVEEVINTIGSPFVLPWKHDDGREGFAISMANARIGWWITREEACDVAKQFSDALKAFPLNKIWEIR